MREEEDLDKGGESRTNKGIGKARLTRQISFLKNRQKFVEKVLRHRSQSKDN